MFLFENILFASFIPQILMFLGLISCFSASLSSTSDAETTKSDFISHESAITYSCEIENSSNIFHFYDYGLQDFALNNNDNNLTHKEITTIKHPNYLDVLFSANVKFTLFSRPPPNRLLVPITIGIDC